MNPDLLCGAAAADITPRDMVPGIRLAGFENNRRAREVLDPLEAVAVCLVQGDRRVVLVAVDLIGFTLPWQEKLRERLAGRLPQPENVLVASTHNHAGPDTIGLWGRALFGAVPVTSGVEPAYMDFLMDALEKVVVDAATDPVPATAKCARFAVPANWTRNDREGGGKEDAGYSLAFDAIDGARIATVVNFAAHPETLWEGNPCVSSDYPGAVRRRLRESSTGVPLFFSGALGGMVTPNVEPDADLERRKEYAAKLGADLADTAQAALADAASVGDAALECAKLDLELPLRNRRFKLAGRLGIIDRDFSSDMVRTEMNMVLLGDTVSILTTPGEVTPELGKMLTDLMTREHRLMFCLGCDELGYVLTPGQFADREYRYERSMSLGPGTGPALLAATARLEELLSSMVNQA